MGLVCWRYTLEGRLPPLESIQGPEAFDLFMCEEDGTVDRDFPSLDWRESFSKYGFHQLALVPRKEEVKGQHRVTLHLPDGSFTELSVERTLTLGELLEQGLQKRRRTLPSLGHSQVGGIQVLDLLQGIPLGPIEVSPGGSREQRRGSRSIDKLIFAPWLRVLYCAEQQQEAIWS